MSTSTLQSGAITEETYLADVPLQFTKNWTVIQDMFTVQHYGFNIPASGHHVPGIAGIVKTDSTAGINACYATCAFSGCLAWDNTIGQMKVFRGGIGWRNLSDLPDTSIYVKNPTDAIYTSHHQGYFSTERDTLTEFNADGYFYPKATGTFLVTTTATFSAGTGAVAPIDVGFEIRKCSVTYKYIGSSFAVTNTTTLGSDWSWKTITNTTYKLSTAFSTMMHLHNIDNVDMYQIWRKDTVPTNPAIGTSIYSDYTSLPVKYTEYTLEYLAFLIYPTGSVGINTGDWTIQIRRLS